MAVTANSFINVQTPNGASLQFTSSSTAATYLTLYTAGANGSMLNGLWENNNDSATHLITLQIQKSSTNFGGAAFTTVANEGFANATAPRNVLALWPGLPVDQNGNPFLILAPSELLVATFATNVTAATVVNLRAQGGDF